MAKTKWRALAAERGWGKDDSVESSLALLSILSTSDSEDIRKYFSTNFFLERKSIKPDRCMALITNGLAAKIVKSAFFQKCISSYQSFLASTRREGTSSTQPPPLSLLDSLDGSYWKIK